MHRRRRKGQLRPHLSAGSPLSFLLLHSYSLCRAYHISPTAAFLRMQLVVTLTAYAYQISAIQSKLGILVKVLYVMYGLRRCSPAVPLAHLAQVSVSCKDCLSLLLPLRGFIKIIVHLFKFSYIELKNKSGNSVIFVKYPLAKERLYSIPSSEFIRSVLIPIYTFAGSLSSFSRMRQSHFLRYLNAEPPLVSVNC